MSSVGGTGTVTRLFRVDPRLVHATLMNAWVPATGAEQIIVADSHVTNDPRMRAIMEMSAMDLLGLAFVPEEAAKQEVERHPISTRLIVLFSSLESAERAIAAGLAVDKLNIGHLPEGPG